MKNLIIGSLILLAGCGSDEPKEAPKASTPKCAQSIFLGTWFNPDYSDTLRVTANCKATSDYCGAQYVIGTAESNGTVNISVLSTNGNDPLCFDTPGEYSCAYNVTAADLTIDCGSGPFTWQKK